MSDISNDEVKPEKRLDSSKDVVASTQIHSLYAHIVQSVHLVWLDGRIGEINNKDFRNSINKLRQVVNNVSTFVDVDECIDFITDIKEEKVFLISSGSLGQTIIPLVHDSPQISKVFILCAQKARHEQWEREWYKVVDVYTDIIPICKAVKQAAQDCDQNFVPISFVDNNAELKKVNLIEKRYHRHQPISWYTYECFLYSMINRALRTMEVDLIIKMGSLLRDLHNHIATLHLKQYGGHQQPDPSTVYYGQGLSQIDFDQLKNTLGELLSFNNFLSTSRDRDFSLKYARRTIATSDLAGMLFVMEIDPSITTTSFANIENIGYYPGDKEILFSMHSVFRVGQVNLILISDNDQQLHALTELMREETKGSTEWFQLGKVVGEYETAQQLYEVLLNQTHDDREIADIYYQLGWTMDEQGEYADAIKFYEKSLEIRLQNLPPNHPDLASSYNNISMMYDDRGEYSKALSYCTKALEIKQKTLPANHPDLTTSYNNIGTIYDTMRESSKSTFIF
jgi:tetratricopeptide (TPR) repeat protein